MDDLFTTGSSIMPQKKNPDGAELIKGKTGESLRKLICIIYCNERDTTSLQQRYARR